LSDDFQDFFESSLRIQFTEILEEDVGLLLPFVEQRFEEIVAIFEVPVKGSFSDAEVFCEWLDANGVEAAVKKGEAGGLQPIFLGEAR
jgi:hypothetical protein